MNDFARIPVQLPLDSDGLLRRECPSCEQQFKWFWHEDGDVSAETVDQYFCPLCGVASGTGSWFTPAQVEHLKAMSRPAAIQSAQESLEKALRGVKGIKFKPERCFSVGSAIPEVVIEPDDMQIVEPPCHANEPVKIPDDVTTVHCLVCGITFAI